MENTEYTKGHSIKTVLLLNQKTVFELIVMQMETKILGGIFLPSTASNFMIQ